ncbi:hypothetical protein BOC46_26855 [Burkholderia pseudomallei]|nr:hypothetical protein BOC46_26855 [Burkholderia pseudomallei]
MRGSNPATQRTRPHIRLRSPSRGHATNMPLRATRGRHRRGQAAASNHAAHRRARAGGRRTRRVHSAVKRVKCVKCGECSECGECGFQANSAISA